MRSVTPRSTAAPTSVHAPQLMRQSRQATALALAGEQVEEGIGCRVIRLAARAQHRRDGREEHEEVERVAAGERIQQMAALHLGCEDAGEAIGILLEQACIVEHARAVHHAAQRRAVGADARQQRAERGGVAHVQASATTVDPSARSTSSAGTTSGVTPRRPMSTRRPAPRSASQRATSGPRPERPPVTR